jgi:hypothetical protein
MSSSQSTSNFGDATQSQPLCTTYSFNRFVQPLQAAQSHADKALPSAVARIRATTSNARARRPVFNATRNVPTNNSLLFLVVLLLSFTFVVGKV